MKFNAYGLTFSITSFSHSWVTKSCKHRQPSPDCLRLIHRDQHPIDIPCRIPGASSRSLFRPCPMEEFTYKSAGGRPPVCRRNRLHLRQGWPRLRRLGTPDYQADDIKTWGVHDLSALQATSYRAYLLRRQQLDIRHDNA